MKTTTMQSLPGVWSGFFRWIGKDRRCRAQGHGSGVAVAASACGGALRCVRASQERARERRGEAQERGSEARGSWALLARPGRRGGRARRQLPWRACARCAATMRPVPLARGGGRLALASRLGWHSWAAQGRGGPGKSLLPFISVFFFNFLTFV